MTTVVQENVQNENTDGEGDLLSNTGMTTVALMAKLQQLHAANTNFQLMDQFMHDVEASPANLSFLRDSWNKIVGLVNGTCSKTAAHMKNGADTLSAGEARQIINEVRKAKIQMANDLVIVGAIASAAIMVIQCWRLQEVWSVLKDAKNVVTKSAGKIQEIEDNMDALKSLVQEVKNLSTRYETPGVTDAEKQSLLKVIRIKVPRLEASYSDARGLISDLRVTVDGRTQVLASYQREQISNGLMNMVHGLTNLVQCFQFSGLVSSGMIWIQRGVTLAFFGLAGANTAAYIITGKTLNQLREILKQLDSYEAQLRGVRTQINAAEDWLLLNDQ